MTTHAVIAAAGEGSRLGLGPKAFVELSGRPLLSYALEALAGICDGAIAVVVPHDGHELAAAVVRDERVILVNGGTTRAASVLAGLDALSAADDDIVLVHDVARPLQPASVMSGVRDAVVGGAVGAAPAVVPAATVRVVDGETVSTIDRDTVRLMQTPQAARVGMLRAALAAHPDVTDDLEALALAHGWGDIAIVAGSVLGRKVTSPDDLALVTALASHRAGRSPEIPADSPRGARP